MDNDVQETEYCIGFSTAITRAKDAINRQRTTLGSHERIGVFRVFGRNAGFTALYTAYVTSARCVIPEYRFDLQHLVDVLVEDRRNNPSRYSFVIASEGALPQGMELKEVGDADAYGHRHKASIGEFLADEIKRRTGIETVDSELTYDLRSGEPDAFDQMVAITFANVAMELVVDGKTGPDDGDPRRALRLLPHPRARGPDRGRRAGLQRRALPPALREQDRPAGPPDAVRRLSALEGGPPRASRPAGHAPPGRRPRQRDASGSATSVRPMRRRSAYIRSSAVRTAVSSSPTALGLAQPTERRRATAPASSQRSHSARIRST